MFSDLLEDFSTRCYGESKVGLGKFVKCSYPFVPPVVLFKNRLSQCIGTNTFLKNLLEIIRSFIRCTNVLISQRISTND